MCRDAEAHPAPSHTTLITDITRPARPATCRGHLRSPDPPPSGRAARRHRAITRLDYTPPRAALRHSAPLLVVSVVKARITNSNLRRMVRTAGRPLGRPNHPVSALMSASVSQSRFDRVCSCPRLPASAENLTGPGQFCPDFVHHILPMPPITHPHLLGSASFARPTIY